MDDNKSEPRRILATWQPKSKLPVDLVIAYEDEDTRDRAISLSKRLTETLLEEYDVQCSWWPITCLRDPDVCQRAIGATVEADLILISLRSGELPGSIRDWVDHWSLRHPQHPCALVLLVHESQGASRSGENYLRNAAQMCQMDFFLSGPSLDAQLEPYSLERIQQRAQTVTPLLEDIMSPRYYLRGSPVAGQPASASLS